MVLIQLLLPTLAARFDQENIHVRAVPVDILDEGQQ
jgi:hypothetical protein